MACLRALTVEQDVLCDEDASVKPGGGELPQSADFISLKLVVTLFSAAHCLLSSSLCEYCS